MNKPDAVIKDREKNPASFFCIDYPQPLLQVQLGNWVGNDESALLHEMRLLACQRPRFRSGRIYRLLTQRDWAYRFNLRK